MSDLISKQAAIEARETVGYDFSESELSEVELEEVCGTVSDVKQDMIDRIKQLPSAEPEPYLDSIVSEIEKTISETRESGKHHDINVRANGELICHGLQLALEIIEEKRNERSDRKTSGN